MPISEELVLAGKYVKEALVRYEQSVDDPVYPELWGYEGMYHQAIGDLPLGAPDISRARRDFTGRAVNYGGKATSIPTANYGISMDKYKSAVGILSADWTWDELRKEELSRSNPYMSDVDVVASYRMALEHGLKVWMHLRTVFGDPTIEFTGLLTSPYVETISVAVGSNGVTGTGATAQTSYDWFRQELTNFRKATKLTSTGTAIITSENINSALDTRFSDGSGDGTVGDLLLGATGAGQRTRKLQTIASVNEFDGASVRDPEIGNMTTINGVAVAADADLVLMIDSNVQASIVRHYADMQFLPVGLLDDQMTYRQVGLCATSEVIYTKPFCARLYILNKS